MKRFLWVLLLWGTINYGKAQEASEEKGVQGIRLSMGHSSSLFIQNNSVHPFTSNGSGIVPSYFKLSLELKRNMDVSGTYKYYNHQNFDVQKQGDVHFRKYHAFDLSLGHRHTLGNTSFIWQNSIMLSARTNGTENVLLHERDGNTLTTPQFNQYSYRSFGVGAGTSIAKVIYPQVTIGVNLEYNYYFESKKLRNRSEVQFDSFERNYKVNRHMITPSVVIGYQLAVR